MNCILLYILNLELKRHILKSFHSSFDTRQNHNSQQAAVAMIETGKLCSVNYNGIILDIKKILFTLEISRVVSGSRAVGDTC